MVPRVYRLAYDRQIVSRFDDSRESWYCKKMLRIFNRLAESIYHPLPRILLQHYRQYLGLPSPPNLNLYLITHAQIQ